MKKLLLLLLGIFTLNACSINETIEAQFEFNNAIYRVLFYDEGTPEKDLKDYVSNTSNSEKTTFYFFYPKNEYDLSVFSNEKFNLTSFSQTIVENKPDYGFYKMPNDKKVYDDAIWLLEQSLK